MIYKLCAVCQRYFVGELNGSYVCPHCRDREEQVAAAPSGIYQTAPAPRTPPPSRAA